MNETSLRAADDSITYRLLVDSISDYAILMLDPEGRVMLGEGLKAHAHIKDEAVLVGLGDHFRIWEPERFRAHLAEATARVRALKQEIGSQGATRDSRADGA